MRAANFSQPLNIPEILLNRVPSHKGDPCIAAESCGIGARVLPEGDWPGPPEPLRPAKGGQKG